MNRLVRLFQDKGEKKLLSIYYTAGYPTLNSTLAIAKKLAASGADFLEIGFPYSDPVADGPVIQHSSETALKNGMTLKKLFEQLKSLRQHTNIPVLLMGYVNPMLQFGVENFCKACVEVGIDGVIVPDLPLYEYQEQYKSIFLQHDIANIFLISPQTSPERICQIDDESTAFVYMVSSSATTGRILNQSNATKNYFERVKSMKLKHPLVIGFGISDASSFQHALDYADAAIIGTAFVKLLEKEHYLLEIPSFIQEIRSKKES